MTLTLPPPGEILSWLGGHVDIRVEVDTGTVGATFGVWDTSTWDAKTWGTEDVDWADVTLFVFDVDCSAGMARWGERFESGSATLTVDNTTGIFTPESGVDYWPLPFRPGRTIRIVAIPDAASGTKVALFTGQIDSTFDHYDDAAHALTTTVQASDFMAVWSAHNPLMLVTPTGVQSTDARVEAALDRFGWPAGARDIQTGVHTMQSSFLAQTTLEECQRAADAEGGIFGCDRDGNAVFKARDWLSSDTRSANIQGFLGYDELPYDPGSSVWDAAVWDTQVWTGFELNSAHIVGIETSWEAARVVNQVTFARVGGRVQHAEDVPSQSQFGIRTYSRTDFECRTNTQVATLAARHLAAFKDARMRVDTVTITAVEDPFDEDRNRLLWDSRIGDRIALLIEPPWNWSFEKEVHIMAIRHNITADDWTVTFQLDDAQTYEGA